MEYLILAVGIFSIPFVVTFLVLLGLTFIVTLLVRRLLKSKYIKELALSKSAYEELANTLDSEHWKHMGQLAATDKDILALMQSKQLDTRYKELSRTLDGCNTMLASLYNRPIDDYDLNEANALLSYINEFIENEGEKIYALQNDMEQVLLQANNYKPSVALQNDQPTAVKVMDKQEQEYTEIQNKVEGEHDMMKFNDEKYKEKFKERVDEYLEENESQETPVKPIIPDMPTESSVFAKGIVIDGNVTVTTPLLVKGEIRGNLICKERVEITEDALITGDVSAASLCLENGKIAGNVNVEQDLYVGSETFVKGNIQANSMDIQGSIEGNVTADGEISFSRTAMIMGDIHAKYIDIEKGAKIAGKMNIGENLKVQSQEDNL
ncbi:MULTISPECIES: polymer-forming cytoskeletal protein [unclassified Breznakia]|uniref:bactofilin family protein n=1 Tax=unclassified Breznakia TaxID=2623764 RepID=UPI00247724B5|nr:MULTISPECIES: polymer-forming cytoskeletal protein [unclassified Breznakia]MDH6368177.1 cytoskeletal protein CcmA (bactofilin family) [Breznakia sp. PH1-1]MDH6405266.1 cytoskeletal protein CcmA (bactofilin family) [Breznakia sp. PF1-11]MDH6412981.1 cytoskeletal protein CcmA (bactofilin family) [Breznakia sp. PFB1-11]MDH6415344.1 cytoskeletal protein CcmA (bactofilin family) [Breznakia sp. PFB1-14]MDH6417645.1 cytoskeletal protein CcmA (bactofilin family) [Breznakia sp. PFB1-4]